MRCGVSAAPDRSSGKGGHEMYVIAEGSVMIEKDGVQLGETERGFRRLN